MHLELQARAPARAAPWNEFSDAAESVAENHARQ